MHVYLKVEAVYSLHWMDLLVTYIDHKQTTQEYREVSGSGKCNSGNTNQDSSAKAGGTTAGPGTVSYHLPSHVDPPQAAVSIPLLRFSCLVFHLVQELQEI